MQIGGNNMQQNISEKDYRNILGAELSSSEIIESKINDAYNKIRNKTETFSPQERKNKHIFQKVFVWIGTAAAVFVLMILFSVTNPVLASEIPVFGGFFTKLADWFSFGAIPEKDTITLYSKDTEQNPQGENPKESPYVKTSNDITVTLTEQYATNQAIFIGVQVKNKNEFPQIAIFADGTQHLQAETAEQDSFRSDEIIALRTIEGTFEDAHTFNGILRIDYSEINVDDRKYQAACQEAEKAGKELALVDSNIDQYLEEYQIPNTFIMNLEITDIVGSLAEPIQPEGMKDGDELEHMSDDEWESYMNSLPQDYYAFPNNYEHWYQKGSWSYKLTITPKDSDSRIIEVNQTNDAGIGIKSLEISSIEMTLNTIEGTDTFAVALDADGNKMENGSSNAYELAIAGHDISKVYIYICDYTEYMDEIKGYGIPGNHLDKSFQEVLEERALFKTVIDTTK